MGRLRTACSVLALVTTFYALVAASASALEWLANGKPITEAEGPLVAVAEGLLTLGAHVTLIGTYGVACEVVMDGDVGPGRFGLIEDVLNTAHEIIGEVGGLPLSCLVSLGTFCGSIGTVAKVWVSNLSLTSESFWTSELLTEGGLFLNKMGGVKPPGFTIECPSLVESHTCKGVTVAQMTNEEGSPAYVDATINKAENEAMGCDAMGITGFIEGDLLTVILSGGTEVATSVS